LYPKSASLKNIKNLLFSKLEGFVNKVSNKNKEFNVKISNNIETNINKVKKTNAFF
jgi:hypothetical protein